MTVSLPERPTTWSFVPPRFTTSMPDSVSMPPRPSFVIPVSRFTDTGPVDAE